MPQVLQLAAHRVHYVDTLAVRSDPDAPQAILGNGSDSDAAGVVSYESIEPGIIPRQSGTECSHPQRTSRILEQGHDSIAGQCVSVGAVIPIVRDRHVARGDA